MAETARLYADPADGRRAFRMVFKEPALVNPTRSCTAGQVLGMKNGPRRIRTFDPLIKSQLL